MHLDAILLLAALAAPIAPAAAPAKAAPAATTYVDRGVRFGLPAGYQVKETTEKEPGEEDDLVWIATKGQLEIRAEVEKGQFECTTKTQAGAPRPGTLAGRATCEVDIEAPPSLGASALPRRATSLLVQFAGRYLSVVVFAPTQAEATKLARQVGATAAEEPAGAPAK